MDLSTLNEFINQQILNERVMYIALQLKDLCSNIGNDIVERNNHKL